MDDQQDILVAVSSAGQLSRVSAFVAVVQAGSFTQAARKTGVDKSTLSRRVRALEDELAVRLLHRTTRSVRVTEAGRRLQDRVTAPLGELALALAEVGDARRISGRVRVATLTALGQIWVAVAGRLRAAHPELLLELATEDSLVSLVDEGFDLAVRAGHLPDSSLVARRLATWRYVLVAAPGFVAAHPTLTDPTRLVDHWLLYGDVPRAEHWRMERGERAVDLRVRPTFIASDAAVLRHAALAGLGVAALPPFFVEADLAAGTLVRVLPEWRVGHTIPVWGVLPHRSHVPARVQVVLEAMAEALRSRTEAWQALTG